VAGLFDLSHMGRVYVTGPGAAGFLQRLLTNDVDVEPGRAVYTLMCNEKGGVIDDLVVYRQSRDAYLVVVNASNREKDLAWMAAQARGEAELSDRTHEVALIAIQGPRAEELLPATGLDLAAIPYFGFAEGAVAGVAALVSRTGYTGEDGFEVFVPAADAVGVWQALLDAGRAAGLLPAGLGARDACRLEAGLRLYGNDMDEATNPYDAGLGWTVKLGKGEFVGSAALAEIKARGAERELVGLNGRERTIPRHGAAVSAAGRTIGEVTSGTYSFFLNRGIGMASVARGSAPAGTVVELDSSGRAGTAEVAALPLYRGSVRMPKPVKR
jgi:aminomethyltransferase